ncbi:KilA-N domain-containing protein [Saccharospirillum salsuginis]|uniref:KilA/APSES-type HTH DNA-binding domain-containing protein n=1 Tax=Saccharospirillum salsuginis TaxID=418750 RepID=A0A918NG89_9GAMM|nr:KilA-N domain-containing protein [Saccharospirillum salsuginis]GGX70822.1 hypothetical protein GCM10007392_42880 [Saccharospirillum salsuginis]
MAITHDTSQPRSSQNNSLTVLSHSIRRQGDFYSLNDLHEAAGGDPAHHPDRFLETPQAKAWASDMDERHGRPYIPATPSSAELKSGSVSVFARRELVEAYALWVGSGFALAVLQAFGSRPRSTDLDPKPLTRYDLGYVRDLRWDEDRSGDAVWWEFDGLGALTAEEAVNQGWDFFEQTRQLARMNPGDAEMALKHCLMRWFEGGFRGRGFHYCEMVFCEWLSRAAVAWMASSEDEVLPLAAE